MAAADRSEQLAGPRRQNRRRPSRHDRFRVVVEASPAAIIFVDGNGTIVFVNAKTEQLFGYRRRELEGQLVELLVPERYRAGHPTQRAGFFGSPRARPMGAGRDLFGVRKDGSEFPVEIGLNPVETEEGVFVLVSIVDISERKGAEAALRRTAEDLARSNADLEQFAYAASHDLQEPLRMITSYLQLLEKRCGPQLDEQAREFVGHAVQGAQHMGLLIDGLLAYSRAGTSGLRVARFPVEKAVQQARHNLQTVIAARHGVVRWSELPEIEADFVLLVEVFQNLISNALKFCDREPCVELSARSSGGSWIFRVCDNGIGIEPAFFERIFGVFQRLHPRDHYPGSGIGLAICRKIVERHGGWMRVAASSERGSAFEFSLPGPSAPERASPRNNTP